MPGDVGRPVLETIRLLDLRGYASLDAAFGPGPHLVWGPNAAGKTSLLEAMALLAWGRSHRTSADGELIRWGTRPRPGRGPRRARTRSRSRSSGPARPGPPAASGSGSTAWPRRAAGLAGILRVVLFAPEEMLLIAGSPVASPGGHRPAGRRRARRPTPTRFATYGRTLQQRNSLLRAIREEGAGARRAAVLGRARSSMPAAPIVAERRRLLDDPGRTARGGPRRDRPRRGGRGPADPPLRDERPATPRRVAPGRPRPAPGRDGREGGLERLHARRAASRRPGLRARRPRPGRRSPRAASSGRRSWRSSSPSSTS